MCAAHPGSATFLPPFFPFIRPTSNVACTRNAHMGALMTQPVHAGGINLITIRRVPLYKTRSLRRLISDNGKSVEELLSLAAASSGSSGAPQSFPSDQLPIERLTNFMDVCAHTHPDDSDSSYSDSTKAHNTFVHQHVGIQSLLLLDR